MKQLAILGLSVQERQRLIEVTKADIKATEDRVMIVEALNFIEDILEKLKTSNISLAKIKAMLGLEANKIEKK
jgi:hypothetical protein